LNTNTNSEKFVQHLYSGALFLVSINKVFNMLLVPACNCSSRVAYCSIC